MQPKLKINKDKFIESGELAEIQGYLLLSRALNRLVNGLYIFKTRKAEILSGSATFYIIIGFCPMILLLISIYGKLAGDIDQAYTQVIFAIKTNIPNLAPWILKSIEKIIKTQLREGVSINLANIVILAYGSLGFSSSLNFGINILAQKKPKGGMLFDEVRSILSGSLIGFFIITVLVLSSLNVFFGTNIKSINQSSMFFFILKYQILQIFFSFIFFTLFYKFISPVKVRFRDAIYGAIAFITLFIIGKAFYWIYLHYAKDDFIKSFGNFYTLIIAIIWIYYLICSFYFGASVALAPIRLRENKINSKKEPSIPPTPSRRQFDSKNDIQIQSIKKNNHTQ